MTRTVTLSELRQRALVAADMATLNARNWITDAQLSMLVNDSGTDLHDQLVTAWQDYFVKAATINAVAGTESYTLPVDFYKKRSVSMVLGTSRQSSLPFNEPERAALYDADIAVPRHKIEDGNLLLVPPTASGPFELRYVYQYPWLNLDTDSLSYNVISGWDAFIVYDVAAKLLIKQKRDASMLMAFVDRFRQRIASAATEREAGGRRRIVDVYGVSQLRSEDRLL